MGQMRLPTLLRPRNHKFNDLIETMEKAQAAFGALRHHPFATVQRGLPLAVVRGLGQCLASRWFVW
jgi:hypothetical protein